MKLHRINVTGITNPQYRDIIEHQERLQRRYPQRHITMVETIRDLIQMALVSIKKNRIP